MIKKLLALVVCLAIVAALVPSYVGAASPGKATGLTLEQQYTQAIDELQRYLSISETGNIALNAPNGIVKSINGEVYQTLLAGLKHTNWMIDSGYVVCNTDFTLTYTDKYIEACSQYLEPGSEVVAEGNAITLSSTSGGIDGFYSYWWGYWIYLSDATCDAIVSALYGGAGIIDLLSGIFPPASPIALIAAGIMAVGATLIFILNINNTGIRIRLNKTFQRLPAPPWILTWVGAQPDACGVVTGRVTDYATGNALPYSTVTATQSGQVILEVGTDSNGRYSIALSPGTYMVTASHSGYYDLGKPVAVSDGSSTTRDFQLTKSTGGGGCPFLQVWDGSEYVDEGLLNIHNAEDVDVTYEHTLTTVPEAVNGAYEFRLTEHPKTISHIDQVQLRAILEDGTVKEFPLRQAWHSEDGNVLNLLLKSDNLRVQEIGADHNGGTSQSIDLEFAALGSNAKAVAFVFMIEGYNMIIK
ncbi:MAG: carboxypeptidase regulatory-like domain-containing protein [Dehalococcoidia bacterium]|nr:carboxypeptidase regulatory-like domain-containing protein [Dehalococcoidia bacterium]